MKVERDDERNHKKSLRCSNLRIVPEKNMKIKKHHEFWKYVEFLRCSSTNSTTYCNRVVLLMESAPLGIFLKKAVRIMGYIKLLPNWFRMSSVSSIVTLCVFFFWGMLPNNTCLTSIPPQLSSQDLKYLRRTMARLLDGETESEFLG